MSVIHKSAPNISRPLLAVAAFAVLGAPSAFAGTYANAGADNADASSGAIPHGQMEWLGHRFWHRHAFVHAWA